MKLRKWVVNLLFVAGLFAIVMLTSGVLRSQRETLSKIEVNNQQIEEKIESTQLKLQGVQRMLEYTRSDEYVEKKARELFGWVREDEYLFVGKDSAGSTDLGDIYEIQQSILVEAERERKEEALRRSAENTDPSSEGNEGDENAENADTSSGETEKEDAADMQGEGLDEGASDEMPENHQAQGEEENFEEITLADPPPTTPTPAPTAKPTPKPQADSGGFESNIFDDLGIPEEAN